jgi:heparosan-N-sulfate-glucuronate 5-epimerase
MTSVFALPLGGLSQPALALGPSIGTDEVRGYYIDFRSKALAPRWPPSWFPWPGYHRYMAAAQWGLGAYERYLLGEGETWLDAALAAGRFLVGEQEMHGPLAGGWFEPFAHQHTFRVPGPWLSAMTQGQCASLLVRLSSATDDSRLAESALRALGPLGVRTTDGGVRTTLSGDSFLEEYPTSPPSFVLNGAIFALWGYFDVARALGRSEARAEFVALVEGLARNLHRWDTGYWSRYDLYPHPIRNVASPFYHVLHISQLRALDLVTERPEFGTMAARFDRYNESMPNRVRALVAKAAFRLVVPHRARRAARRPPAAALRA